MEKQRRVIFFVIHILRKLKLRYLNLKQDEIYLLLIFDGILPNNILGSITRYVQVLKMGTSILN